jgi:mono/diheme cytochrome c family protein
MKILPFLIALWVIASGASSRAQTLPVVPPDHARAMQEGLALFKEHVRPALVQHCLDCHGGKITKGEFDLSDREALVATKAIEGGSKGSRMVELIAHEEEPHMPKKAAKLPEATIEQIRRWIDLGAPYDKPLVERKGAATKDRVVTEKDRDFWSFRPLASVTPPEVKDRAWGRTAVDRFVLARLEGRGLKPNPMADRRVLIRRVSFDLIGLPPSPEEVDAFVADPAPDAYEKLVDRLLDSPHFGERWARHWMDVARFAESHGYEQDYDRPFAYHYRDFLIRALNQDLPFDQFLRWQVAGDELEPDDPRAMAATGFLGAGAFPTQLTEAEFESARYEEINDMTATTGSAFLGLSVGCARCHDHKFDPIPAEDYYRMASAFTSTIRSEVDLALTPGEKPTKVQVTAEGFPHTKHHADERGFPHFYKQTFVLNRGDVNQKKREASPGFLRVLMRDGRDESSWHVDPPANWSRSDFRRASLARWMTDPEGGAGMLAARVAVNRLWQHHFGRGIVDTPNDFGAQGSPPSHPELLEYLAGELIRGGWRLKPLHKLTVMSAVYLQNDEFDESRATIDRENVLLWRRASMRLEAEPVRDAMLKVAGLLDGRMYGLGSLDESMRRRAVYFFIKRSQLIPTMMLFDWPEHLVSIGQRGTTTTASQALMFLNSKLGRDCAEGLAARVLAGDSKDEVRQAYRLAYGREPTSEENQLAAGFLAEQTTSHEKAGRPDPRRLALADFCQALMGGSEFIYVP